MYSEMSDNGGCESSKRLFKISGSFSLESCSTTGETQCTSPLLAMVIKEKGRCNCALSFFHSL